MPGRVPHSCLWGISLGSRKRHLDQALPSTQDGLQQCQRKRILYWLQGDSGQGTVTEEADLGKRPGRRITETGKGGD